MSDRCLDIRLDGRVERVTLNRPEVRNAFGPSLIEELHDWARSVASRPQVRVAVLSGAGRAFSAGADLSWMAESAGYSEKRNREDARRMAAMFEALDTLPVPLVGCVHGAALGGGTGLVAVCDIVVAEAQTLFGFTEVKLGLVPAVISPYVVRKIGTSAARECFLTGARFDAQRAKAIGLVHAVAAGDEAMRTTVEAYVRELLSSGPEAIVAAKRLIEEVAPDVSERRADLTDLTAEVIAARRVSVEGQEGIRAFLGKRKPEWAE